MELKEYIEKGGQKLRLGYTTGSCAAAAAKAAALMLLTGEKVPQVRLSTPRGTELYLESEEICFSEGAVSCGVRKDSGDDPDVTDGILVRAEVACSGIPGIRIDGGEGVGRVTRPGLDQLVGNAAINSTPRRMIAEAVQEAVREAGGRPGTGMMQEAGGVLLPAGFDVTVSVPRGRELAAKTFNPKLGIEGGISILGTSGIVEPMSDRALLDTIRAEISIRREENWKVLPVTPGNYGRDFLSGLGFSDGTAVVSSNFICDTVRMAADAGFSRLLLAGHIGKLVKVAGGVENTHSQFGDRRMEILTEIAGDVLLKQGRTGEVPCLSDCATTDDAVRILKEQGLDREVLEEMTRRIQAYVEQSAGGQLRAEVLVFSNVYGELGRTDKAGEYLRLLRKQGKELKA